MLCRGGGGERSLCIKCDGRSLGHNKCGGDCTSKWATLLLANDFDDMARPGRQTSLGMFNLADFCLPLTMTSTWTISYVLDICSDPLLFKVVNIVPILVSMYYINTYTDIEMSMFHTGLNTGYVPVIPANFKQCQEVRNFFFKFYNF